MLFDPFVHKHFQRSAAVLQGKVDPDVEDSAKGIRASMVNNHDSIDLTIAFNVAKRLVAVVFGEKTYHRAKVS